MTHVKLKPWSKLSQNLPQLITSTRLIPIPDLVKYVHWIFMEKWVKYTKFGRIPHLGEEKVSSGPAECPTWGEDLTSQIPTVWWVHAYCLYYWFSCKVQ